MYLRKRLTHSTLSIQSRGGILNHDTGWIERYTFNTATRTIRSVGLGGPQSCCRPHASRQTIFGLVAFVRRDLSTTANLFQHRQHQHPRLNIAVPCNVALEVQSFFQTPFLYSLQLGSSLLFGFTSIVCFCSKVTTTTTLYKIIKMSGSFLKAAVGRGLREAGAALKEQGGAEVRNRQLCEVLFLWLQRNSWN